MIIVPRFSKSDTRSLTDQLVAYARLVTNDENSFDMIEVFTTQMSQLFASLSRVLDRESEHLQEERIGRELVLTQHEQLTDQLEQQLTGFVALLRAILRSAQEDARFLTRHRDSIAQLFLEGDLRVEFLESAQKSIDVENRFLSALRFLEQIHKRSNALIKDLRKLRSSFDDERQGEKVLALLESCRMRADALHEQCRDLSIHIPGLRDMDAASARKLGMLAKSMRA